MTKLIWALPIVLLVAIPAYSEGWKASVNMHRYGWRQEFTQSLSKDFGKWTAQFKARQLEDGNHIDLSFNSQRWGVEWKQGKFVGGDLSAYQLTWPDNPKTPYTYKTPADKVLHAFVRVPWRLGQMRFDYFEKDSVREFEFEIEAEW